MKISRYSEATLAAMLVEAVGLLIVQPDGSKYWEKGEVKYGWLLKEI